MSRRRFHWNDPRTGLIELYNEGGVRLTQMRYRGASHRRDLIERWEAHYGAPKFATFHFAITPDIHDDSLSEINLDRPTPNCKYGLMGREVKAPEKESPWGALKKRGLEESADAGREVVAGNAPVSDFEAPSCHDLGRAVGWERLVQIDAKISALQKTA